MIKVNVGTRPLLSCEEEAFKSLWEEVPCPDSVRVGTWTICSICSKPYVEHPYIIPHYFLNQLCDGRIVKL